MKARPMLFTGDMVRALLDGRKRQTRRLVPEWQLPKLTHDATEYMSVAQRHPQWGFGVFGKTEQECMNNYNTEYGGLCPFGRTGDLIYVREKTIKVEEHGYLGPVYAASELGTEILDTGLRPAPDDMTEVEPYDIRLRPSIHMHRSASRITLRITSVRVERLRDISAADAAAEGCDKPDLPRAVGGVAGDFVADERTSFAILWNRINGSGSWSANPWVWVIEFDVIKANVDAVIKQMEAAA
ncbi:ASCH domain-containing protein [Marinobacterium lutimaris]|uniref:ASCH domain-containing protein n=1 Tax=Marinobacterium lutimaris TaxID=568106 RepID=A0A1H5XW03_9GAMM|nr:hypothetical protein [Marinobacterium lutimaris]SEG15833.1 hypothetical protein SAMN05444390_1011522 [Marinobacterium lutimaris]